MSTEITLADKKKNFGVNLQKMSGEIQKALPSHINKDVFIRVVTTSVARNPKLLECTPASLFGSIIQASQLGLMPDGILGEAHLIPYKVGGVMTCNYQTGYKGILKLVRRTGNVQDVRVQVVYQQDEFDYDLIEGIRAHRSGANTTFEDKDITHFYCVIKYKDGGKDFAVMTKNQMDQHMRKFSKAWDKPDSPWKTNYPAMGKKTVIIQAAKYADMSTEVQAAISLDELSEIKSQRNSALVAGVADKSLSAQFTEDSVHEEAEIMAEETQEQNQVKQDTQAKKSESVVQGIQGDLLGAK